MSGMFYSVVAHRRQPNLHIGYSRRGARGVVCFLHVRSRMTIDPRTYNAGAEHVGCSMAGRTSQSPERREVVGESHEG